VPSVLGLPAYHSRRRPSPKRPSAPGRAAMPRLLAAVLAATLASAAAFGVADQQGAWASEVLAQSGPGVTVQSAGSPQVETPPGFAGASFTCVTTPDGGRGKGLRDIRLRHAIKRGSTPRVLRLARGSASSSLSSSSYPSSSCSCSPSPNYSSL